MQITIQAETFSEFKTKLASLMQEMSVSQTTAGYPMPTTAELNDGMVAIASEIKEVQKAKAKSKAKPVEVVAEPVVDEVVDLKVAVQQALQDVNAKKGLVVVRELLATFSAQRLSEVPATKYPDFIKACKKLLS